MDIPRDGQTESQLFILLLQACWAAKRSTSRAAGQPQASKFWDFGVGMPRQRDKLRRRLDSSKPSGLCKIWDTLSPPPRLPATCQCGWGRQVSVGRSPCRGALSQSCLRSRGQPQTSSLSSLFSKASTFSRLHLHHRSSIAIHKLDSAVTLYLSVSTRILPRLLSLLCRPLSHVGLLTVDVHAHPHSSSVIGTPQTSIQSRTSVSTLLE